MCSSSGGQENDDRPAHCQYRGWYKEQWEPWIGEMLPLERDPTNPEDSNAVAVKNGSGTVGHVLST